MTTASIANELPRPVPTEQTDLSITGMTCAACVRRIEKAVRAVPGVSEAVINLVTQRASISFDPGKTERGKLVSAIENAGYGVVAPTAPQPNAPTNRVDELADHEAREQQTIRRDFTIAGCSRFRCSSSA